MTDDPVQPMGDDPYQPDTQQHTLRDRIAAVLERHCGGENDWPVGTITGKPHEMAEVAMRELGLQRVVGYCEEQAAVGWRDTGTADEAFGRNIVAETVLTILEGQANE